jgi:ABC-type multidrug transport system fused ATPase/permease subunit
VPRLQEISKEQADARAHMTGRIVDSYTNIQTIKLFAHTRREQDYARDAMDGFMGTVHRQMRLVTKLTLALQTVNALLLAGIAGLAIYGWYAATISLGAIAVAIALVMRIRAMSDWVLWEIAGLFENIGTVQDGMNTIALPRQGDGRSDARDLVVTGRDRVRPRRLPLRTYGRRDWRPVAILVLDEATSALDSEVEAAIQEQLAWLMAGKTVLAIAHRLSTIAALDRLVVMDEGRIVEEGSHDALLRRGGLDADLWQRQSGGFLCSEPEDDAVAAVSAVVQ